MKERLRKLADIAERKEYEELVRDVAPRKEEAEPFSSYKDQIGFGKLLLLLPPIFENLRIFYKNVDNYVYYS